MGILINKNTKVVVQGITGREGSVRTKYMKSYGTHVVGGTSPGKKGSDVHGVPVYNTVKEIAREHGEIDFSVIFVPGHVLKTAVMEAADAGVKNVIPCVEGTPIHDIMEMIAYCKAKGTRLLGPGSIGIITPGEAVVGWLGGNVEWANTFFKRGSIGVFSRSGGQSGTIPWVLREGGFGVSTVIEFLAGFPTTQYSADTLVTYIKDIGTIRFEMGYATTIAVFLFALMMLTNFIITTVLKRFSTD
mgnify:CR=1 FL=1